MSKAHCLKVLKILPCCEPVEVVRYTKASLGRYDNLGAKKISEIYLKYPKSCIMHGILWNPMSKITSLHLLAICNYQKDMNHYEPLMNYNVCCIMFVANDYM